MKIPQTSLAGQLRELPLAEGENQTEIPYLHIYKSTERQIRLPQREHIYLHAVADGSVRLYSPSGIMDYTAGQYFIAQIDTPITGHVLTFSEMSDFLMLSAEFAVSDAISVVLELEGGLIQDILSAAVSPAASEAADESLFTAIRRLLSLKNSPVQRPFMEKLIRRELIFHVLCGSLGRQLLQSIIQFQQAEEIYGINSWIKKNFRTAFTVEELAGQGNISVSLFHQKFKRAVGMGPLQCQKRLRLTEARRLMLDDHKNVTEASSEVGYESVSQFTRDYRKAFGAAPKEDILKLRSELQKQAGSL